MEAKKNILTRKGLETLEDELQELKVEMEDLTKYVNTLGIVEMLRMSDVIQTEVDLIENQSQTV